MSDLPRLYNAVRAVLDTRGFDADLQTRIALFLGATTAINAAILAPAQVQGGATAALPFVHGQYFREVEFASLLARVTRWSPNPLLYVEGAWLTAPLWAELAKCVPTMLSPMFLPMLPSMLASMMSAMSSPMSSPTTSPMNAAFDGRAPFAALALGHALLGRVRLAPIIPANVDEFDPFVVALRRIEQENGRMIQAQIRLLKDAASSLDQAERERIVAAQQAVVDDVFARFLGGLAGEAAPLAPHDAQ